MMKFLTSKKEGVWKQRDSETGIETVPLQCDWAKAVKAYKKFKPSLKEDDKYELILCDVAISDTVIGVLHYKINGIQNKIEIKY